jgi:hypothetical protein
MSDEDSWAIRVSKYRTEEPIKNILEIVTKPKFVVDKTIETELKNYFIFVQKGELKPRSIRGPADYETALEIFEEIQTIKDRAAEIQLTYASIISDLERLWEIARAHIILKPEIASAKSDTIRYAVLSKTISELESIKSEMASHLKSAELLTKNLNQTYNIINSQVETVKQMVYWRSLTLPTDRPSNSINRG